MPDSSISICDLGGMGLIMELDEIRREINDIDGEMARLFCRRMDCAAAVADYKSRHSMPVTDTAREAAVLDRVRSLSGNYGDAAAVMFATLMDLSRALQHNRLAGGAQFAQTIKNARNELIAPGRARIVCQGVPGAFSHEASDLMFPSAVPVFVESFAEVFAKIDNGEADYGILPVENALAGSVHEVYDLIIRYKFTIAAAARVHVHHCLMSCPGARKDGITAVLSHPQALSQCAQFITRAGLEPRRYTNTASAAEAVAALGDPTVAAIASRRAAELYGLDVLDSDIETLSGNHTRFVAISRDVTIPADADKISLIFSLPHVTGTLYRILSRFAAVGLNLSKLESRPADGNDFSYIFYVDFEGSLSDERTMSLLCTLSEELPGFTFMGGYHDRCSTNYCSVN